MKDATQRRFGNVRQLPSGRFQARWTGPDAHLHTAPATFATAAQARRWLARVETDRAKGSWVDERDGKVTLEQVADQWRATVVNLAPSTRARDLGYLERYVLPSLGQRAVGELQRSDLSAWVAGLTRRGLAPATVIQAVQVAAKVLDVAVADRRRADNPARGLKLPKRQREEMHVLTLSEVRDLAAAIDPRYSELVTVACHTALRPNEWVALTAGDVDLLRKRITVTKGMVESEGEMTMRPGKTRAAQRAVPILGDDTLEALDRLLRGVHHADDLLFEAPKGGYLRLSHFRGRIWRSALRDAGIDPEVRPYDMRHTAISLWIAAGFDVKAIATWAGHVSVATILDIYGHLMPDHAEMAHRRWAEYESAARAVPAGDVVGLGGRR